MDGAILHPDSVRPVQIRHGPRSSSLALVDAVGGSAGRAVELRRYRQADALRPIAPPAPGPRGPRRRLPGAPGPLGGGAGPVAGDRPEPPWRIPAAQGLGAGPQPLRPRAANTPQAGPGRPGRPGVNRIARFPSSSGRFPGAGMILIPPWIQTLHHTQDDPVL